MRGVVGLWLLAMLLAGNAQAGDAVHVENASRPTRCAEEDNVYVKFLGAGITRLAVEARHPVYIAGLREDNMAADFSDCDTAAHDPDYPAEPKDVVLYDGPDYALIGHSFAGFWRPATVDFRVGDIITRGLHLVQLFRKIEGQRIEILVVYPPDGYWRAKPLPPRGRPETGYGSSFLVGPIEEDRRPFVALTAIEFMPSEVAFHLSFKLGRGSLRLAESSRERTQLDITLPPASPTVPFAALRSMFVAPDKADTARVSLSSGADDPAIRDVMAFTSSDAHSVTFERTVPGRHNTSAPDLTFAAFGR